MEKHGRLIDADALLAGLTIDALEEYGCPLPEFYHEFQMLIEEAPTVDAIPIDWIDLFQSTPIGGDRIDDMVREWRYKLEVEAERAREEGKQA